MKLAQYSQYGGPEVIEINDIDKPVPRPGQVLVEVKAAALNPFDEKVRSGIMKDAIPLEFPVTIGADFAGVVTEITDDVTSVKVGDEVFGSAMVLNGGSGAVAEYAAANATSIAKKSENVSFEEAAAIVLVGISATQALEQLNLEKGKKILIHGGAGGIGSTAIQLAKHLGAYVATAVKAKDFGFVRSLGADEVIDYENQKFEEVLKDYDAVFDTVSGETYIRSFNVLKKGGTIISMNEQPDEQLTGKHEVTALHLHSKVNAESLNKVKALIEEEIIKPQIAKTFPLEQTVEAFNYFETGHPQGKVVIRIS
jgi:alcohol dehydrogenase